MIEQINDIAHLWWSVTIAMSWQVSVLIVLIGCIDIIIRKWAWPQLRYALWLMVLIKLILPPTIYLSTSVTSRLEPLAKEIVAKEDRRENLSTATAIILARFETSLAEAPAEAASSRDTLTAQQSAPLFADFENAAGESPNMAHVKLVWQAYAMAVWLAGMFILGGWLIFKLLPLRKEDRRLPATASLPESFYNSMARCARSLELRRIPKVILTRRVACPAVFGMVRPVLLMPVGYLRKMTHRDIEHVLLHELAHIKRGDLWVHGFYMLLQVVYWYNPLLWLVRSQMHHLRELCCDATVARLLKERISEYRQTLIDVARRFLAKSTEPSLGLLGLFEDSNRLLVRLNWLKKETWRYQKMKKLTVVITIVLMVAFVLPMAAAQDKPSTENSSADSVQAKEQSSQIDETSVAEQNTNEPQTTEQLLQARQALQVQLQQLQIQRQKLQQQLQALTQARLAEDKAEEIRLKANEANDKAIKASKEAEKATKDQAAKAKASFEARKAGLIAKQQAQWANSDAFKQWQKAMEQWAKEQAQIYQQAQESGDTAMPAPNPKPRPMPEMPPMTTGPVEVEVNAEVEVQPEVKVMPEVKVVDTPKVAVSVPLVLPTAPAAPALPGAPVESVESTATLPEVPGPKPETNREVKISRDKNGKYIATTEMHFTSKVKPGSPFIVRNNLGNITLRPSKDATCDVKAVIRAEAKTADKAKEMVEQMGMNIQSSDDRYYLKPVKADGGQWGNLSVDFTIAVPVGVQPDIKTELGNIELYDLRGDIKAVAKLGSVKAVNTTGNINLATDMGAVKYTAPNDLAGGNIELVTNMGDIEFIAPKNLSARLKVETKMGSIKSGDLLMKVSKIDMFKSNAEGTFGAGQASVKIATNMGNISLKLQPSSQDEPKP